MRKGTGREGSPLCPGGAGRGGQDALGLFLVAGLSGEQPWGQTRWGNWEWGGKSHALYTDQCGTWLVARVFRINYGEDKQHPSEDWGNPAWSTKFRRAITHLALRELRRKRSPAKGGRGAHATPHQEWGDAGWSPGKAWAPSCGKAVALAGSTGPRWMRDRVRCPVAGRGHAGRGCSPLALPRGLSVGVLYLHGPGRSAF